MATSRLIKRHIDKGRSMLDSLSQSIEYGKNPDKTRDGTLISFYECDPRTASLEFLLAKKQYKAITGREQSRDKDVLLYQIRQAFPKGEIAPEDANKIAYELALRFTKGNHAFLVCTHKDKAHIHSHIYFNSTTLDCTRKFVDFSFSARALRRMNDTLCVENGLSIVRNPKPGKGKHYGVWLGDKRKPSFQEQLKQAVDIALEKKPKHFEDFLILMEQSGIEVLTTSSHVKFKLPEQKRPTRCNTLKGDYTELAIRERIEGKRIVPKKSAIRMAQEPQKLNLLIDIQKSIKAKDSPGYEQWAKVFNLKQAAQTLIMLQENNIKQYEQLSEKAEQAADRFNKLGDSIREIDIRLGEIADLQKHIGNYGKTKEVYAAYKKSRYSRKFFAEHETEILLHKEAKKAFDALGLVKLPSVKNLRQEYATLLAEKKKQYFEYYAAKREMREFLTAKSNVDRLLQYDQQQKNIRSEPEK